MCCTVRVLLCLCLQEPAPSNDAHTVLVAFAHEAVEVEAGPVLVHEKYALLLAYSFLASPRRRTKTRPNESSNEREQQAVGRLIITLATFAGLSLSASATVS
jgi:hypothetical protein